MSKIFKKKLIVLLAALVFALGLSGVAEATIATKQVKVNYAGIKLYVDGKAVNINPSEEPFAINGVTYVPLRLVGEALNCYVNWQGTTKTINISSKTTTEVNSLKTQVSQKDKEIGDLKKKIAELEQQLEQARTEGQDLSDLEDDLLGDYDELGDVSIDGIKLDGDKDEVDVEIEVDLDEYESEWDDLTDREIEDWLEDLVGDIQDKLSEDTEVNGTIINTGNDDVLVEFYKDGEDDLDVDFEDDDYRNGGLDTGDVEDDLLGDSYDVGDVEFSVYYVDYDEDDDEIVVYLEAADNDASSKWDDMSQSVIESDVESICEDIAEIFEDDAGADPEVVDIYFYDESSDLLDSFTYDVDSGTLD
ncbi:hypothetical protein IT084_01265 [Desulfallas sp. Bu1-1]|uniref:stalk domain-containing protein n=1 Tax=Desulfallas sp. Bu1-1 TaxID=2787620 RepID=UPI00189EB592|nr:stalk domain-containing protein [Desulfallas sp. Bu1-1]MBF7081611.1 hypothetical protein [Desulfallas sp. Bu1-1]